MTGNECEFVLEQPGMPPYEQPLLTRMAVGIVAAVIVAFAFDRWLLGRE